MTENKMTQRLLHEIIKKFYDSQMHQILRYDP